MALLVLEENWFFKEKDQLKLKIEALCLAKKYDECVKLFEGFDYKKEKDFELIEDYVRILFKAKDLKKAKEVIEHLLSGKQRISYLELGADIYNALEEYDSYVLTLQKLVLMTRFKKYIQKLADAYVKCGKKELGELLFNLKDLQEYKLSETDTEFFQSFINKK